MKTLLFLCLALMLSGGCKSATDAANSNNFSADISYDGGTASHYISDDFNVHFKKVSGDIDTLVVTADKGALEGFALWLYLEIDSLHKGSYPISANAQYLKKGVRLDYTKADGSFFTSSFSAKDSLIITDIDIAKQSVKGTFHTVLFQDGIQGGKTTAVTNGTFSWNY